MDLRLSSNGYNIMPNNPPRRVEEGTSGIPDPVAHSVNRLMDDMYFKDGSVRDRLKGIETTLSNTKWLLGVITVFLAATFAGVVKLVFYP